MCRERTPPKVRRVCIRGEFRDLLGVDASKFQNLNILYPVVLRVVDLICSTACCFAEVGGRGELAIDTDRCTRAKRPSVPLLASMFPTRET